MLCRIEGRVQGVGYRAWMQAQAVRLGVDGWVRNEADGAVSACFSGPEAAVREMVGRCREGPPAAEVTAVTEQTAAADDAGGDGFVIRR